LYIPLKDSYGVNTPIFIEDLNSEQMKELEFLKESGDIKEFDTDVYYFPRKTLIGDPILSVHSVIVRKFITDGDNVYGYIAGLSLENLAGVSTQLPRMLTIVTNKGDKSGIVVVGYSKVILQRPPVEITKENVSILQFLDLLSSIDIDVFGAYENYKLLQFKEKIGVAYDSLKEYCHLYPKATTVLERVG